jgi:O-antigen/teichoic acid export membrane protein
MAALDASTAASVMKPLREFVSGGWRAWLGPRGRQVLHGSAWALVARAAGAANLLLSIPLVLNAIGAGPFGVWATLVSLALLGGSLDFGLGNGAMNLVATARGRDAPQEIRSIIAAARAPMIVAGLLIGGAVGMAALLLPWATFPQLAEIPAEELRASVGVLALAITLAVPLSLATKVLMGLGDARIAFQWQAAAQLLTLALTAALAAHGGGLIGLVSAALFGPLAGSLAQALTLARRLPREQTAPMPELRKRIYRSGALFFGIQLCAMVAFGLDLTIITALATPEQAASYATVQRVFQLVPMSLAMLWAPLWPAYRHAIGGDDLRWAQKTLKNSVFGAILFAMTLSFALALAIVLAKKHGTLPEISVAPILLAGFVVWTTMEAMGTALATFLNAIEALRVQLLLGTLFAGTCLAAKILAVSIIGPDSMPWTTAACYATIVLLPLLFWWLKRKPV